jgi:hypothetical protein
VSDGHALLSIHAKNVIDRNLDDEVYLALKRHAESAGISVPELLRRRTRMLALESLPE